jgi:hypothetical protein
MADEVMEESSSSPASSCANLSVGAAGRALAGDGDADLELQSKARGMYSSAPSVETGMRTRIHIREIIPYRREPGGLWAGPADVGALVRLGQRRKLVVLDLAKAPSSCNARLTSTAISLRLTPRLQLTFPSARPAKPPRPCRHIDWIRPSLGPRSLQQARASQSLHPYGRQCRHPSGLRRADHINIPSAPRPTARRCGAPRSQSAHGRDRPVAMACTIGTMDPAAHD